jgi:hypothetical protein
MQPPAIHLRPKCAGIAANDHEIEGHVRSAVDLARGIEHCRIVFLRMVPAHRKENESVRVEAVESPGLPSVCGRLEAGKINRIWNNCHVLLRHSDLQIFAPHCLRKCDHHPNIRHDILYQVLDRWISPQADFSATREENVVPNAADEIRGGPPVLGRMLLPVHQTDPRWIRDDSMPEIESVTALKISQGKPVQQ